MAGDELVRDLVIFLAGMVVNGIIMILLTYRIIRSKDNGKE